jgi:hypothetical protein
MNYCKHKPGTLVLYKSSLIQDDNMALLVLSNSWLCEMTKMIYRVSAMNIFTGEIFVPFVDVINRSEPVQI